MKILNLKSITGPNVYHHQPIVLMKIDLEDWVDRPSKSFNGFNEKLLELLPGLRGHHCSPGYAGGFVERLRDGTYLAHVIEHVALEFSELAGIGVTFGKTRYCGHGTHYEIAARFLNEEGMKACLFHAYRLVESLAERTLFDVREALLEIAEKIERTKPGPTGEALMKEAQRRGLPVFEMGGFLQIGYGKNRRRLQAAITDRTSLIGADLVQNKEMTKLLLAENLIPVPLGRVVRGVEEVLPALAEVRGPYAVKPLDGHHGHGVSLNLRLPDEVLRAFQIAKKFGADVLIEEMCFGHDYRILVIGGEFAAASLRAPPRIEGDGVLSVQELIETLNRDPRRGEGHAGTLSKIEIDDTLIECQSKQGYHLFSVPARGSRVNLRENANISGGGTARDVTALVHPRIRAMCERIARLVDLDICGIDLIHRDISEPPDHSLKVIEVNAAPGLRMHLSPSEGEAQPVAAKILDLLYPPGATARIPLVSVTGTNGKTTVVRLLHRILSRQKGRCVGMTTTDGIWIGDQLVSKGDMTGPQSARAVLSDPLVDAAVLETARGGLLRGGLAYDWADVAVVTKICHDHIGQDGIEDLEDLVWIKSLVAERVREGGTLVLNADDEEALRLMDNARVRRQNPHVLLYSLRADNPNLVQHLGRGGEGFWFQRGWLMRGKRELVQQVAQVEDLGWTMRGQALFQVSNALAATAAAFALNVEVPLIQEGLRGFNPAVENRGRANLYRLRRGHLLLDYGHNGDAISAVGEMLKPFRNLRKTVIFGLPGDRADHLIRTSVHEAARFFDRFILRDDLDLRGRRSGEVPGMMEKFLREVRPHVDCEIIEDQVDALETALEEIQDNEVIVVFYDELEPVMRVLRQFDPEPADSLPPPDLKEVRPHADYAHEAKAR
jgi:cyanophycin synthetase